MSISEAGVPLWGVFLARHTAAMLLAQVQRFSPNKKGSNTLVANIRDRTSVVSNIALRFFDAKGVCVLSISLETQKREKIKSPRIDFTPLVILAISEVGDFLISVDNLNSGNVAVS